MRVKVSSTKNAKVVDNLRAMCYAVGMEGVSMQGSMNVRRMAYVAMCVVLMAICSWITIPATVPFTLQTFAVFTTCALLGGRLGLYSVCVYILLGAVGLPVFSGFGAGFGVILGPTGGYMLGFVFTALSMWGVEARFGRGNVARVCGMVLGLALCYAFGTAWFMAVYARGGGAVSLGAALSMCVLPFILPDCAKIALATLLSARLRDRLKLQKL